MTKRPKHVRHVDTPEIDDVTSAENELRAELIAAQVRLGAVGGRVVIDLSGDDRPLCHDALHRLIEWLDPRRVHTHVLGPPRGDEELYPPFWRYWMRLPRRGDIALMSRAWTMRAVMKTVQGAWKKKHLGRRLDVIRSFEKELIDDGIVLLKVWFHAPDDVREERREKSRKRAPWRLDEVDDEITDNRKAFRDASVDALETTSEGAAPWHVITTDDRDAALLALGRLVVDTLERAAGDTFDDTNEAVAELPPPLAHATPSLAVIDHSTPLDRRTYETELDDLQASLHKLFEKASRKNLRTVIAFEGGDAAGKGGAIRRLIRPLDARDYDVVRIAAPTPEELAHHYLWRFWKHIPQHGQAVIFDRTWYGRVLVERVEGYAAPRDWQRAYAEINAFEQQLVDDNTVLVKFWLEVSPDVQLERFRAREDSPHKRYKITPDDWRNREKRELYDEAVEDMLARTHTESAPWTLVSANDKHHARITVLRTVKRALKHAL